jgi:hypothetical protein
MPITFENDNDVIVYAFEKVIFYARNTQQIFVAQCVWWLASIIGLEQGLVNYIDNRQARYEANILPEKIPVSTESVLAVPREIQEDKSQDTMLKECEEFLRESVRLRDTVIPKAPKELRQREVSAIPRDIQEVLRGDIKTGFVHPDRRNQIQDYESDISDLDLEEIRQERSSVETESIIPRTRKQRKEFNKQKQGALVPRPERVKVTKPVTTKQRKFLQSIPKDTISEYLRNRK